MGAMFLKHKSDCVSSCSENTSVVAVVLRIKFSLLQWNFEVVELTLGCFANLPLPTVPSHTHKFFFLADTYFYFSTLCICPLRKEAFPDA